MQAGQVQIRLTKDCEHRRSAEIGLINNLSPRRFNCALIVALKQCVRASVGLRVRCFCITKPGQSLRSLNKVCTIKSFVSIAGSRVDHPLSLLQRSHLLIQDTQNGNGTNNMADLYNILEIT
jgi:hypothetical protein